MLLKQNLYFAFASLRFNIEYSLGQKLWHEENYPTGFYDKNCLITFLISEWITIIQEGFQNADFSKTSCICGIKIEMFDIHVFIWPKLNTTIEKTAWIIKLSWNFNDYWTPCTHNVIVTDKVNFIYSLLSSFCG